MPLPSFNEHDGHAKLMPLTEPSVPASSVIKWLCHVADGRDRSGLRVLDLGCGKGGMVAWLLEQGFDAYGLDVRPDYIANGSAYVGSGRLKVLDDRSYPFADDYFDIVLSNQVFEHVLDLPGLAREVSRTTKPGGLGLHIFPARWTVIEPHMFTPVVHWLPKGPMRRAGIKLALRAGKAAPYFVDRSLDERVAIFANYSETETFYRAPKEIKHSLESAGLSVDFTQASRDRMLSKLGRERLPLGMDKVAVWVYRTTRMMCLTTVKV